MEGKILGNRYELISLVGKGGMAVVYKAKDRMLNRYVAVKILREEYKENEEFIHRFNVESQAAAALSHQNIVQIYDVGEEEGIHYIVMELLEGCTLKQYIKEHGGKLSWREAANFSMQICRALEHAHSKHVVHRDIKPQNIIITDGGKIKVADFGIARAANNNTTVNSLSSALGSAHYLSPEQAKGCYTDHHTDLYSLGVVMYEMFCGKLPFDADSAVSVVAQHINENPVPPREINPDIPVGIEAIIMRAMMKEQRLRYDSASEILEDIVAVYQNPTVNPSLLNAAAPSDTPRERNVQSVPPRATHKKKKKKKKKNTGMIAAISVICTVLAIAILAGVYMFFFGSNGEVEVPELVGLTYEEALKRAARASKGDVTFDVTLLRSEHSNKEKDIVISQTPEGKSTVKRSREIKVVVSSGPVVLELKDYTGEDYETVKSALTKLGIKVIKKEADSDTYSDGEIVKQVPAEGSEMAEGDEVTLYVSAGTKNTVVPDVLGKTADEAIVLIERNKLKVGKVTNGASSDYKKGQVYRQSKDAFETVPVNTVIDLYVSNGEKPQEEKPETPDGGNTADKKVKKTLHLTLGNLPKDRDKVNIRLVSDGQTFYEKDFPTSSGTASISFEATETLSLDVYYDGVYITTKEVKY